MPVIWQNDETRHNQIRAGGPQHAHSEGIANELPSAPDFHHTNPPTLYPASPRHNLLTSRIPYPPTPRMDTFTHAEISTISHLKQLITCMAPSPKTHTHNTLTIIAQLKSIYSPSSPRLQSYDVLFLRKGTTMLARAIGYWDTPFRSWQFLLEGSSSGGFSARWRISGRSCWKWCRCLRKVSLGGWRDESC